jgi:hypothetical protein
MEEETGLFIYQLSSFIGGMRWLSGILGNPTGTASSYYTRGRPRQRSRKNQHLR